MPMPVAEMKRAGAAPPQVAEALIADAAQPAPDFTRAAALVAQRFHRLQIRRHPGRISAAQHPQAQGGHQTLDENAGRVDPFHHAADAGHGARPARSDPCPGRCRPARPSRLSTTVSPMISVTTRRRLQPTARRVPISRVRSNTLITIAFIMPSPPIRMAMAAIPRQTLADTASTARWRHIRWICSPARSLSSASMRRHDLARCRSPCAGPPEKG